MENQNRYQLRFCAGKYWLLDMEQEDFAYRQPIAMNETGALIVKTFWETQDLDRTAEVVAATYGIGQEEALQDVKDFLSCLPNMKNDPE